MPFLKMAVPKSKMAVPLSDLALTLDAGPVEEDGKFAAFYKVFGR